MNNDWMPPSEFRAVGDWVHSDKMQPGYVFARRHDNGQFETLMVISIATISEHGTIDMVVTNFFGFNKIEKYSVSCWSRFFCYKDFM